MAEVGGHRGEELQRVAKINVIKHMNALTINNVKEIKLLKTLIKDINGIRNQKAFTI